jgi:prophage tail gpP-like protein
MPKLKLVNQNWAIGSVTFRKDMSGTHADLILMPPDAFDPEPKALELFDAELTKPAPNKQSPATLSGGP